MTSTGKDHGPVATMVTAADLANALNKMHTARQVRLAQLEQFIRDLGLEAPPYKKGWELP